MTLDEAKKRVAEIAALAGDDETAHGHEDTLHWDVLEYFAAEAPEPFRSIAAEVLKTGDLDFARWCA